MQMQWKMKSPVGLLYLVASEKMLCGVHFMKQNTPLTKSLRGSPANTLVLANAVRQLNEYFDGKRKKFDLPLEAAGTPFQKSVWGELRKIPYGKTASYKEVARQIKKNRAVRAVGSANGKNPHCIIVPCHRVIAHDGSIGGYSGGLGVKKKLLRLECVKLRNQRRNAAQKIVAR